MAGLLFWSVICAPRRISRTFTQLIFFRAAEGLGESFYFPASMSFLADYHGPSTRSRAMSIHQTSVYLGTAGGAALTGFLANRLGWRSPFWVLGVVGIAYAVFLIVGLVEPRRNQAAGEERKRSAADDEDRRAPWPASGTLTEQIAADHVNPFAGCFWAFSWGRTLWRRRFSAWLPTFIFERFDLGLDNSSFTSTFWPLASLPGAILGEWPRIGRRGGGRGGRIRVQASGLILAAPFVFLTGWSTSVPLLIAA